MAYGNPYISDMPPGCERGEPSVQTDANFAGPAVPLDLHLSEAGVRIALINAQSGQHGFLRGKPAREALMSSGPAHRVTGLVGQKDTAYELIGEVPPEVRQINDVYSHSHDQDAPLPAGRNARRREPSPGTLTRDPLLVHRHFRAISPCRFRSCERPSPRTSWFR